LSSALQKKLNQETATINTNKAQADNMRKMLSLQNQIEGIKVKLLEKAKIFIKEGDLMKISKGKYQERRFFLFDSMLIYAAKSKIGNEKFAFKKLIELENCLVQDSVDSSQTKNALQITNKKNNKTYVICAQTPKDKASWLRELELVLEEFKNKNGKSLNGTIRPIWKPDEVTDNCFKCNMKFTMTKRKHHCRSCGQVFCSICSNFEAELPVDLGYVGKQRVCQDCFNRLQTGRKGSIFTPTYLLPHNIDHSSPMKSFKEGYLVKKGHNRTNWKRRFFILREGILKYYKNEHDIKNFNLQEEEKKNKKKKDSDEEEEDPKIPKPKGTMILKEFDLHPTFSAEKAYKWTFMLKTIKKQYVIRAENAQDHTDWMEILGILVNRTAEKIEMK